MARNRVLARGNELTLPVLAGVVSGSPVVVGMLVGVALTSRDGNCNAVIKTDGVWLVSVTGAVANVGAPIYINSVTYALTVAPGIGVQLWGHALDTKGAGTGTIRVRVAHHAVANGQPA
jgi:predicted RecA/RadA family phage recombinase